MTMTVSAKFLSSFIDFWAVLSLTLSRANGNVTTPITSAPFSLAILATMGAAPLPVPPPIPAVTNTRLQSPIAFSISVLEYSAALAPISGNPPAPRPLVRVRL